MKTKNEIVQIIFEMIDEINKQNETNLTKDINARLFGKESTLDSLGLVNLIVSIEEAVNEKFDVAISIVDEKAMSQVRSPFRTIDTLADYILELLN
jgi:acyl carrier protein